MVKKKHTFLILLIISVAFFSLRILLLRQISSASGGDVYEFLLIARKLKSLHNPFIGVKRLPGFPLFLIPGDFGLFDGVLWARLVSAFFATISILPFFSIIRKLKYSNLIAVVATFLFSINHIIMIFSLRPLAYSAYTFFFLFSLLLAIEFQKNPKPIMLGAGLGMLSMIRHEGFLISAVLAIFLTINKKKEININLFKLGLVFLLYTTPFFIYNLFEYKNPVHISYIGGGGLYQPTDMASLVLNLEKTLNNIFHLWGKSTLTFADQISKVLIFSLALLVMLFVKRVIATIHKRATHQLGVVLIIILPLIITYIFGIKDFSEIGANLSLVLSSFALLGLAVFMSSITRQKWLILLLMAIHLGISLWFQPSSRYLQQVIPFISLFIVLGWSAFFDFLTEKKTKTSKLLRIGFYLVLSFLIFRYSYKQIEKQIRISNFDTKKQHSFTQAIKYLSKKTGGVAIEPDSDYTRSYIAIFYLGEDRTFFLGDEFLARGDIPIDETSQTNWIKSSEIKWIIDYLPVEMINQSLYEEGWKNIDGEWDKKIVKVYESI